MTDSEDSKTSIDENRPKQFSQFGIKVTESTSGFVYLTRDDGDGESSKPLPKLEKKRSSLLKQIFVIGLCVKMEAEFKVLPAYNDLPSKESILSINPRDCGGFGCPMVAATESIATYVGDVKSDVELLDVWLKAEIEAGKEASALPLVVQYGLKAEDSIAFNQASEAVRAAIKGYHDSTKGSKDPKVIMKARETRDAALLSAVSSVQHLAVLFMTYSMLPSAYTRRHQLSKLKDRKKIMEKKEQLLHDFRASCIDAYHGSSSDGKLAGFSYKDWLDSFIKGL